jgi:hypothetical protein
MINRCAQVQTSVPEPERLERESALTVRVARHHPQRALSLLQVVTS